ncbi:hypothetical protein ACTXT7_002057 [Hymenolepis weldensis]
MKTALSPSCSGDRKRLFGESLLDSDMLREAFREKLPDYVFIIKEESVSLPRLVAMKTRPAHTDLAFPNASSGLTVNELSLIEPEN